MKKTSLVILFFFLIISIGFAQRRGSIDSERLEAARVAFITTRLDLSTEQAEKFWPIFNEYNKKREANLKEIADLTPRNREEEITDQQAKELISKRFSIQKQMIDEEEKFVDKVSQVISYQQILKLNGLNRDFARMLYQRQRQERRQ
ncbi:hypothetical protein E4S40_02675 [Algoriphagus kandeliae]|uniref:Sensor of ECF-type sigma factor n=1 Tax=Algoriphagus kandeliae TaxID=2562278 RepID=A0A4Y9R1X4_9BACT|nr:hypothetical protein [Algoriphagus kandeliae]TFV97573.1 hypothetical protein E4S40_02675 [Algoriphagus kandeliae]